MICYCWQLALLSCLTVILTLLTTKFISQKVRHFSRKRQSLLGKLNSTVEEMIVGYHTVVAYNHQDEVIDSFCETADALTKEGIKTDVYSGVMGPIMNCIGNIGFVIIAVFGGYFSLHGYISIGVISAFIVYAKQFSRPINEIAQIDDYISSMPDGYETFVEEQGASLSGGQKQRLSIARAILKSPEILIFDDSTSALDLKTEAQLYESIQKIYPQTTKLIVAQRIASIRYADRIIVLDNGHIIAMGSHDELMKTCQIYQDIYYSQLGEKEKVYF